MRHLGILYPNPIIGEQLRKVEVRLKIDLDLRYMEGGSSLWLYSDWKYLLVDEEHEDTESTRYDWQKCIHEIKHLRLVLDFVVTDYDIID
jgi:hypothetical protein